MATGDMVQRAAARTVFYTLLNTLSILYVIDYVTLELSTQLLDIISSMTLHLHQYTLFRWIVTYYIIYRLGRFAWNRYKLKENLRKKKDDILDKHGRLNEKLKASKNPAVTVEQVGKFTLSQLREQIVSKKMSIVDIIDAFQRRALDIFRSHPGTVAEIVFDSDVYAILADSNLLEEPPRVLSLLHGIPVSLQEIFPIRGYDHTMGFTSRTKKPAEEDCALVAALRNAGAIPFLLTNSRQKLSGLTSENPIFGCTRHPTHPHRACVTGDGVAVSLHASPISFAFDIVGDARLSAAACGLAAFKPSPGRISQQGLDHPLKIPQSLGAVPSPIARTTKDLADTFRSLWTTAMFQEDETLPPVQFNEEKLEQGTRKKLVIGMFTGFGDLMSASTAVDRVMNEAKTFLESKGHRVVEFALPEPQRAYELSVGRFQTVMSPEILRMVYKEGSGDILSTYRQHAVNALFSMPGLLRKVLCFTRAAKIQSSYEMASVALKGFGCTKTYPQLEQEACEYKTLFFNEWKESELDCIVCPVSPLPAVWDQAQFYLVHGVLLYTTLFNMLGCPAGTLSFGRVEREDIERSNDAVEAGKYLKRSIVYSEQLAAAEGLSVNIQVVGKPWDDELVLGLMELLESRAPISDTTK